MKPILVAMLALLLAPVAAVPQRAARADSSAPMHAVGVVAAADDGATSLPAATGTAVPQPTGTSVPEAAGTVVPAIATPVMSGASGAIVGPLAAPYGSAMPPLPPQIGEAMRRHMAEFQRLVTEQQALRRTMLGALTPAHRAVLAKIVGELAIAPNPDAGAAAAQLDAMLSPAETQSVIRVERAKSAAALHEFERIAADPGMPVRPIPPPVGINRNAVAMTASFDNDAGVILLRNAAMGLMAPRLNFLQPSLR